MTHLSIFMVLIVRLSSTYVEIKHGPNFGSIFINRQGSIAQVWKPIFSTRNLLNFLKYWITLWTNPYTVLTNKKYLSGSCSILLWQPMNISCSSPKFKKMITHQVIPNRSKLTHSSLNGMSCAAGINTWMKSTPAIWLYSHAISLTLKIRWHLNSKTHLCLTKHLSSGIVDLLTLRYSLILFIFLNSFLIASSLLSFK